MPSLRLPTLAVALLAIDVLLIVAAATNFLLGAPFARINDLVYLDGETTLQAWYSSVQWLLAGALFGMLALHALRARLRGALALAAFSALCIVFSIDEITGIHEWLGRKSDVLLPGGDRQNTVLWRTGIWPLLIGIPVLVVLAVLTVRMRAIFVPRARHALTVLVAGLVVMFSGALAVELAVNWVDSAPSARGWLLLEHAVEELLEMIGVTLIVWSALDTLRIYGFALTVPSAGVHVLPTSRQAAPHREREDAAVKSTNSSWRC